MDTATAAGRAFASLPQNGDCGSVVDLSTLAIFYATRIRPEDLKTDPINYNVGMWGKLIIIGSVKRQATIMRLNPDVEYDRLDWELIRRDVHDRTIERVRHLMTVSNIQMFFANRMALYKRWFPDFFQFECGVDQLIRQYSLQLLEVQEKHGNAANPNSTLYWDNNQNVRDSLIRSGNTDLSEMPATQDASSLHMNDDQSPMEEEEQKLAITEFQREQQVQNTGSVPVNNSLTGQTQRGSVSTLTVVTANSNAGTPTTPMVAVPFTDHSLSSTLVPQVAPNPASLFPTTEVELSNTSMGPIPPLVVPTTTFGVATHTSPSSTPVNAPVAVARPSPPCYQTRRSYRKYVDENKQSISNSISNSKVEPLPNLAAKKEENKAFLMLLHQRFSQGCIQDMSEILARKAEVEG
ncbi:unnamed protein product [Orchesella dallaii]